jgi:AcrR family transcriptional regulator
VALLATRKTSLHARGIERRRKLLESARRLLDSRELNEITLGDVAADAGVPKGSAYFFYSDIADLYASLQALLHEEIIEVLKKPLRKPMRRWQDVIPALNARGMEYYNRTPPARQLQIGPRTSPELKLKDRQSDVAIGRLYEQHIDELFVLPEIADRSRIFFRAVEIADLMFTLSVLESGTITQVMCAEADRACTAYLESYLSPSLPRRKRRGGD